MSVLHGRTAGLADAPVEQAIGSHDDAFVDGEVRAAVAGLDDVWLERLDAEDCVVTREEGVVGMHDG